MQEAATAPWNGKEKPKASDKYDQSANEKMSKDMYILKIKQQDMGTQYDPSRLPKKRDSAV